VNRFIVWCACMMLDSENMARNGQGIRPVHTVNIEHVSQVQVLIRAMYDAYFSRGSCH